MVTRRLSQHSIVLVMLLVAALGWLVQSGVGSFHGVVPGVLLVLLGALFDGYRAHQKSLFQRACARSERAMALRAAREIDEPLTLIIANLEMTVSRLHPGSDAFAVLHPARDAAWLILDRLRQLTEPTDLPDEEPLSLPRLLQVVEGRTIPLADDPIPARPLAAATSRPRAAW